MSTKRRKHPKLERPKKQYAQDQCGLYGTKGKKELLSRLRWKGTFDQLIGLAKRRGAYREWPADDGRMIQEACDELRHVHARIATLLRRIVPPDYRHSGVPGRSFLTNASEHREGHASLKLDVRKFYPSTSIRHVRKFFANEMACAGDIADALALICCCNGAIPTGCVHSEVLAFYCHKSTFDVLAERVRQREGRITIYVDDIMVTMPNAGRSDLLWARRQFARAGMTLHPRKSVVLRKTDKKLITGVVIDQGILKAPPEQHLRAKQRMVDAEAAQDVEIARAAARSLLGHLDHIAQIDARFKERAVGNRARLRKELSSFA